MTDCKRERVKGFLIICPPTSMQVMAGRGTEGHVCASTSVPWAHPLLPPPSRAQRKRHRQFPHLLPYITHFIPVY